MPPCEAERKKGMINSKLAEEGSKKQKDKKKQYNQSNQSFIENINKTGKPLARLIKKREDTNHLNQKSGWKNLLLVSEK